MKIYDNVLMKGLYMMATAALALTFAGCSKNDEPEDELKPEVHVGKVEVSSSQVVFPVDGGSKTIAVATNSEWHLDCDYTWMSIDADLNSGTVTVSAEKNTTGATRYGVISVICGDEGYTDSRDIRVMQTYEPEDLVKDGVTANCYIAHTKASYRFPAKVKGNGAGDGNSKYIAAEGLEIKNAAFAELVWEATLDGDKTRSTYVIDGEPMYDGENIISPQARPPAMPLSQCVLRTAPSSGAGISGLLMMKSRPRPTRTVWYGWTGISVRSVPSLLTL